jgi:hypothetical protein
MKLIEQIREVLCLPHLSINLMWEKTAENHAFFARLVEEFYRDSKKRHPKYLVISKFRHGVATCVLPQEFDSYFMMVEASARRNYKKANRLGYTFQTIDFNSFLGDIGEIRRSTEYRQGKMLRSFLDAEVKPGSDPPSATRFHAYPYFGIVKDGKLYAYAGCLIAGEVCLLEHIFGHAKYQEDGIVPLLIIGIAKHLLSMHPDVRYYCYGTYFGAAESMQRFKRKFCFNPHRVSWALETK